MLICFHKPYGILSQFTPEPGSKWRTLAEFGFPKNVYPIGRLDYETEGLLLLTNDGEFANQLMHPRYHVEKTYWVYANTVPHDTRLDKLRNGIQLDDGMTSPAHVEYVDIDPATKQSIIEITITEGRNRQVRRMFEAIHLQIERLKRMRYGPIELDKLPRGKYRHLTAAEVELLLTHKVHKPNPT